jgi:hypothetical protein
MATYADLWDCTDPVVTVEETDLEGADLLVRTLLRNKGIDPEEVTGDDGLALLRRLAVAEATRTAAMRGAADGETVLWRKADELRKEVQHRSLTIDRESLGLETVGSGNAGYGSIPVGRA